MNKIVRIELTKLSFFMILMKKMSLSLKLNLYNGEITIKWTSITMNNIV